MTEIQLILLTGLFWILSRITNAERPELVLGREEQRINPFFAVLVFLPLTLSASLGPVRADGYAYLMSFQKLSGSLSSLFLGFSEGHKGPGFTALEVLIKSAFGYNETAYRLIISLIQSVSIVYVYRKYSDNYCFSVFLFLASGCLLSWMMNGLRQFIAVTLILAGTPWLIEKKYFRMLILIGIAYTIHSSALIMVPIIFVVHGKIFNKRTLLYLGITLVATFVFTNFTGVLDRLLEGTDYEGLESTYRAYGDDGANPIRILVSAVPVLLAFIGREEIRAEDNPMVNICVNMAIVGTGLNMIAAVTSGITIGRLPIFVSLFPQIVMPHLIDKAFSGRIRALVYIASILLYVLYFHFS